MTWAELEQLLPSGFHDARLDGIQIDYRRRIAVFEMGLWAVTVSPENRQNCWPVLWMFRMGSINIQMPANFGWMLCLSNILFQRLCHGQANPYRKE